MYCQQCGSSINDALKYCNNCGAKQKKGKDESDTKVMLDNLLTTLFLVVMFGLGILVGLVAVLLDKEVTREAIVTIIIGYLVAVFGICFMLLSQVKKVIDAKLKIRDEFNEPMPHVRLASPTTAQLEEHRQPAVSVTEHTTRTLEEVPLKRS